MRVVGFAVALLAGGLVAARAEEITVANCLRDGYDIRAAFSDNSGGAYLILQKGTVAYMCHSAPSPRCEKLN